MKEGLDEDSSPPSSSAADITNTFNSNGEEGQGLKQTPADSDSDGEFNSGAGSTRSHGNGTFSGNDSFEEERVAPAALFMIEDNDGKLHEVSSSSSSNGSDSGKEEEEEEEEPAWKQRYRVKFASTKLGLHNSNEENMDVPSAAHPNLLGKSLPIRIPVSQSWMMIDDDETSRAEDDVRRPEALGSRIATTYAAQRSSPLGLLKERQNVPNNSVSSGRTVRFNVARAGSKNEKPKRSIAVAGSAPYPSFLVGQRGFLNHSTNSSNAGVDEQTRPLAWESFSAFNNSSRRRKDGPDAGAGRGAASNHHANT